MIGRSRESPGTLYSWYLRVNSRISSDHRIVAKTSSLRLSQTGRPRHALNYQDVSQRCNVRILPRRFG
jgi:hypothetical protein